MINPNDPPNDQQLKAQLQQAYDRWLQQGAEELANTYHDDWVSKVEGIAQNDPQRHTKCIESRKRLLDTWINKEASVGHWGFQLPFRIVLG
ncbi:MAG: hypothetical protein RBT80_05830 [Candidatus Vecturithrix sp.]|jgi:hypothetical protein|nr:hypothetical protein [Candidatus Vecturithrix sp.]